MDTRLGKGKIYLKAEDLGKMLKLKDIENLVITNVNIKDSKDLEIEIATPLNNKTNNRVKNFKENKIYHIGLEYIKDINKIGMVVIEEYNKEFKIIALNFIKNINSIIEERYCSLGNSIFYVDVRAFGSMIYDKLIQQGIDKESITITDLSNLNSTKIDILNKLMNIKPSYELGYKYNRIMDEINKLQEVVNPKGKILFVNNNPSGFLEALLLILK